MIWLFSPLIGGFLKLPAMRVVADLTASKLQHLCSAFGLWSAYRGLAPPRTAPPFREAEQEEGGAPLMGADIDPEKEGDVGRIVFDKIPFLLKN